MMPSFRALRSSLLSRGTKYLMALLLLVGALMLYLLSTASSNTPMFAGTLPLLVYFGVALIIGLMGVVGYQLLALRRRLKAGLFGSKLTLRMVLLFALVAVLPGALVYAVSVQFLVRSIDTWFNVRVDNALESGLRLGRTTLDNMLKELMRKAEGIAISLSDASATQTVAALNAMREQAGVQEVAVFNSDRTLLAFSSGEGSGLTPTSLPAAVAHKVRLQQVYQRVESDERTGLRLRVVLPINRLSGETALLQVVQSVPDQLARDAESVQTMSQEYQELSFSRAGLKRLYGLSLTLSLLLALLSALLLAILFSERLAAPLGVLAAGTRAVAQGDFTQRHPVRSHDELGILTESFNTMTVQLAEARAQLLRNQEQLEAAKAYLESLLAKLTAGVLSFDSLQALRSANPSAAQILGVELEPLLGVRLAEWANAGGVLADIGASIREGILAGAEGTWERQVELASGGKVLLVRGSVLQAGAEGGFVVVFDDITRLLQAQRYAAWGEVARRLAHEIKNPLTPIQLSAERLEHRLSAKLQPNDAEMLSRSTRTIIQQVAQLKGMVDAFSQYARSPELRVQPLDLNVLVREVLALYEAYAPYLLPDLEEGLPPVAGDAARLRQVIHNLLQNAGQAVAERRKPRIMVQTRAAAGSVQLVVADNGPGFAQEILARATEPYVTTKPKGTGLGLAIVRKIVEEHHGQIEVANVASGGARVSITLPVSGAAAAASPRQERIRVE
jgi:nitrogen fixation/metabolism regulation signal transduction histidine kinase